MTYPKLGWNAQALDHAGRYICGFCGADVSISYGFKAVGAGTAAVLARIAICHGCFGPTYFDPKNRQFPGVPYGEQVNGITDAGVRDLYEEARRATDRCRKTGAAL